jgi:hypothetical protein
MKEKNVFTWLLLLLLALSHWACHKEEPLKPAPPIDYTVLPDATQEGKNTFGCKVNGQVWVPRVPLLSVTIQNKSALFSEKNGKGSGIIMCNLLDGSLDDYFTTAFTSSFFEPRTYKTLSDTAQFRFNPDFTRLGEGFQHIDGDTSNYFTITKIDTARNFISGIFQCTLYDSKKSKKLKITEGRFDMPYFPE